MNRRLLVPPLDQVPSLQLQHLQHLHVKDNRHTPLCARAAAARRKPTLTEPRSAGEALALAFPTAEDFGAGAGAPGGAGEAKRCLQGGGRDPKGSMTCCFVGPGAVPKTGRRFSRTVRCQPRLHKKHLWFSSVLAPSSTARTP